MAGWDTDKKKMKRLLLFFEGDAVIVFSKMEASDKADKAKVASLIHKSFNVTPSEAYRQFKSRKLLVDETLEAYLADLRRMLALAGHADTGEKDAVVIEQFVACLPSEFQKELRLSSAGKELSVLECVDSPCTESSDAADGP